MISPVEFKTWIVDDVECFEKIVQKVIKRFKKIEIADVDERILIIQLIKSKLFQQALKEYSFIDGYAKKSIYASIYLSAISDNQDAQIDLRIKNISSSDPKAKETPTEEPNAKGESAHVEETQREGSSSETAALEEHNETKEDVKESSKKLQLEQKPNTHITKNEEAPPTPPLKKEAIQVKKEKPSSEVALEKAIKDALQATKGAINNQTKSIDESKVGAKDNVVDTDEVARKKAIILLVDLLKQVSTKGSKVEIRKKVDTIQKLANDGETLIKKVIEKELTIKEKKEEIEKRSTIEVKKEDKKEEPKEKIAIQKQEHIKTEPKPNQPDYISDFLKKIGGTRKVEPNPTIRFLESIKDELIAIDAQEDFVYDSFPEYFDEDMDEGIENLHYI